MSESNSSAHTNKPTRRQYRRTEQRRQEILVAVVQLLSEPDCAGVTTKDIARSMGIADGALYRHFTGKAEILQELIAFCRNAFESMFAEINAQQNVAMLTKARVKARALLLFAQANRGLTRILTFEGLNGEEEAVRDSMRQVLSIAEKAIADSLELAILHREIASVVDVKVRAAIIMSYIQGRWLRFVASGFEEKPTEGWEQAEAILFADLGKS